MRRLFIFVMLLLTVMSCSGGGGGDTKKTSEKAITSFSIDGIDANIHESEKYITLTLPGSDRSAMVAIFETTGVSVKVGSIVQESGITENDFTNGVVYTVTAANGTSVDYTVTIFLGGGPGGSIKGKVLDACSSSPIEGAIIDIGYRKATSDSDGDYELKYVAASWSGTPGQWNAECTALVNMSDVKVNGEKVYYESFSRDILVPFNQDPLEPRLSTAYYDFLVGPDCGDAN